MKYTEFLFVDRVLASNMPSRCFVWIWARVNPSKLCPVYNLPFKLFTYTLVWLLCWGLAYTILQEQVVPCSAIFMLATLFTLSYIVAYILSFLKIPPMVSMILAGMAMRNLGIFDMSGHFATVEKVLRTSAMVVILIRSGLVLQGHAFRKNHFLMIKLGILPCLMEALTVTCLSRLTLSFPWLWCGLVGCMLASIAPGILVPMVLALEEKGYGRKNAIATLVIAASSIDNILVITSFGLMLNLITRNDTVFEHVYHGPGAILLGLCFGIIWGIVAIYVPHKDSSWLVAFRCIIIGVGSLFAVHGSLMLGMMAGGPVACVTMSFIATTGWRSLGWQNENPVDKIFSIIWKFCCHVLFSLIGTSIDFSTLDGVVVALGIATVLSGLSIRLTMSLWSTFGHDLTYKEMLFITITWIPKATVQAVIGPLALDVVDKTNPEDVQNASRVLTLSVVAILLTAPLGAMLIYFTGPILLEKSEIEDEVENTGDENNVQLDQNKRRDSSPRPSNGNANQEV